MTRLQQVPVAAMDLHRFASTISSEEYAALLELIDRSARTLSGRVIWNVNSTATGGGVAELLVPLLGYARGAEVDARWVVISGGGDHARDRVPVAHQVQPEDIDGQAVRAV
jgi:trehalose synthase